MKKYFYSILMLLAVVCGLSAWGAVGGVNLLADGDTELTPALDKCVPAENGSVKGLYYILFTFGENETDIQLNPAYTAKTLGQISVPNDNGTYKTVQKVTADDKDRFDHQIDGKPVAANQIVYHLAEPITVEEAATYHIAFGGIFISASGAVNPNIKYDFTIEPESNEPEPLTVNLSECFPAENSVVWDLEHIILTFGENDTDIKLNPDFTYTNVGVLTQGISGAIVEYFTTENASSFLTHEVNGEPLADNQIAIKLSTPISRTTNEQYRLNISKSAFISGTTGGVLEDNIDYNFTVTPKPGALSPIVSTIPADGETVSEPVSELIFVTNFKTCEKNRQFFGDERGRIVNVATNEVIDNFTAGTLSYKVNGTALPNNQYAYILSTPLEAGTYKVYLSERVFKDTKGDKDENEAYEFTFTVANNEPLSINTSACIPAEGGKVDYLPYVVLTFGENDTDIKLNPDFAGTNMAQIVQALSGTVIQAFKGADAATILTHEIDGRQLDDNQIALMLPTPLTNSFVQNCKLIVYKNAFISGTTGQTLEDNVQFEFKLVPTMGALAPITSSIPADGSTVDAPVTEILFITPFELCDENAYFTDDSKGEIVNVETNEVVESLNSGKFDYKVNGTALPDNQYAYFPATPLEAGTYRLNLAARVLKDINGNKDENEEYTFAFTVVGEVEPDPLTVNTAACTPAEGSSVIEVPYVILTFGEKETDIKLNPDFTGTNIGRIANSQSGAAFHYFSTADAATILTHEIDGNKLADNQIALIIPTPLTNTENSNKNCMVYINKDAFVSGTTGGVQELPIQYYFTLTPPPAELLPMDATEPADASKVEAPVTEIVFTCNSKMTIVDINPQFSGAHGSIVNLNTNEVVDDFKTGSWVYESNGQALAENQLAYVFSTPLEAGKYKVSIAEGLFKDGESPYYENEAFEFTFTVVKDLNAPAETFDYGFSYSSYGLYDVDDYSIKRKKFNTNVSFMNLPTGVSLDATKCPAKWVRESDGTVVTAEIKDFLGTMMMFTDGADWPSEPFGVWTCVLPQGLFVAGETESVEKTLKVTWNDPDADAPRPDFAVTKFNFINTPDVFSSEEGQPAEVPGTMMFTLWKTVDGGEDMLDWETSPKSIEALNLNRGFVINTNWDEWITCFIAEVKRKDGTGEIDTWNQETVQEVYGKGEYCKNYVGSSVSDCTPYQHPLLGCGGNADTREYAKDVVYTFDIWFYDTFQKRGMDNSKHELACGSYHFEFTGATAPFEYSEIAKLISVSPVPTNAAELDLADQTAGEVRGLEAPITFTWSAPVTMTAKYSLGSGAGQADVQSCTPNDDNTEWTVIPGAAVISNGEGGYLDVFEFNVQAIDEDGHYVKGNVGEKRNTMFVPRFNFVDVSTGLDAIIAGNLSVMSVNGSINVSGVAEGMTVSIFTLEGLEISKVKAAGTEVEFANVLPGAYLIVVNDGDARTAVKLLHK